MRRFALGWLLLLLSTTALSADNTEELQRLHNALDVLNQEEQAVYQQFQMVQELRRANAQLSYTGQFPQPQYMTEVPNYADVVEAQNKALRRDEDLANQADRLYARYADIEARKTPLLQRIYELTNAK
jgi:hypothetical protein